MRLSNAKVAILVVNGGRDPKSKSWFKLLTEKLDEHTAADSYTLYVWNNNLRDQTIAVYCKARRAIRYTEPAPTDELLHFHAVPLHLLYEAARDSGAQYIVTLDSDAHPISNGWLGKLKSYLNSETPLSGIWRDELTKGLPPYMHASCLCTTVDFVEQNGG